MFQGMKGFAHGQSKALCSAVVEEEHEVQFDKRVQFLKSQLEQEVYRPYVWNWDKLTKNQAR